MDCIIMNHRSSNDLSNFTLQSKSTYITMLFLYMSLCFFLLILNVVNRLSLLEKNLSSKKTGNIFNVTSTFRLIDKSA